MVMAHLASDWAMARRRPKGYCCKVDVASRFSGVCPHISPDCRKHIFPLYIVWTRSMRRNIALKLRGCVKRKPVYNRISLAWNVVIVRIKKYRRFMDLERAVFSNVRKLCCKEFHRKETVLYTYQQNGENIFSKIGRKFPHSSCMHMCMSQHGQFLVLSVWCRTVLERSPYRRVWVVASITPFHIRPMSVVSSSDKCWASACKGHVFHGHNIVRSVEHFIKWRLFCHKRMTVVITLYRDGLYEMCC